MSIYVDVGLERQCSCKTLRLRHAAGWKDQSMTASKGEVIL